MYTALIVDDDEMTRNAVGDLLGRVNFKVENAEDGREGIRKIEKTKYDLILLDLRMSGIDGEQVLKILKKENDSLPIIILSGYLTKDKIIKLSKLGVKGFLTKPI
ncbi:MAG: response regulator, partial [candidate division Zixibacteria bacterium]|nr:response regulator [candidate division Zixibacteria bacterium]